MGMKITPDERPSVPTSRLGRALVAGSLLTSLLVMLVIGSTLWMAHRDAEDKARRASANLLAASAAHIESQMELYKFSLGLAAEALNDPELSVLSSDGEHRMLASIVAGINAVGSLLVLDAKGDIVADAASSISRRGNFADQQYFRIHRDNVLAGVYVSQPFEDPLSNGAPSIAMSRRLTDSRGAFDGILVIAVRLAYLQALFAEMDVGHEGVVTLLSTGGTVLMRQPSKNGKGDIGLDLAKSPNFQRMNKEGAGSFIGNAVTDGEERFYTFTNIPKNPLLLTVGLSVSEMFANWRWRATVTSLLTSLICAAIISLSLLLRRELVRRAVAEADLALLAVTDGLTGLANRRRFEEVVQREWARTRRSGKSLALLMIDADRFKQFNDTYGHARGDEVLKLLARVIEHAARRPSDLGARYGGEEFAVVLPEMDTAGAMHVAETIRREFTKAGTIMMPDATLACTVSIGVKCMSPGGNESVEQFVASADAALYQAKREGRNRAVLGA